MSNNLRKNYWILWMYFFRHLDILSSRKYPLPSGNHFSCLVSATGEFQSDTSNFPQASWSQKGR